MTPDLTSEPSVDPPAPDLHAIAARPQSARAWSTGAGGWFLRLGTHTHKLSVAFPFLKGRPQIEGVFRTVSALGAVNVSDHNDEPIGRLLRWTQFLKLRGTIITDAHGAEIARVQARRIGVFRAVAGLFLHRQPVWRFDVLVDGTRAGGITVGVSIAPDATLSVIPKAAEWIDGRLLIAALLVLASDANWRGRPTHPFTSLRRYDALLSGRQDGARS